MLKAKKIILYEAYNMLHTTWNISRKQESSEQIPELVSSGDSKEISLLDIHAIQKSYHFSYVNKIIFHGP